MRMTNVDVASARATELGRPRDLVVVYPWHHSLSFARYYRGDTPWTTIPSLGFNGLHRYDLLHNAMSQPDQTRPVQPVLDEVRKVLQQGGTIFVFGEVRRGKLQPEVLPPARLPEDGWKLPQYQAQWAEMLRAYLDQHSTVQFVSLPTIPPARRFERLELSIARGWRE